MQGAAIAPPPVQITTRFVVLKWGKDQEGFAFWYLGRGQTKSLWNGSDNHILDIPVDPLTAIGLGLVTPEELGYPAGILAAFNLLSKE